MTTFDITKFLGQLPRVPPNEMNQDEERICPVCRVEYLDEDPDTGYAEHPVRLPCGHNIGKHCILQWLKPKADSYHANSCVIWPHQFFEPWPVTPQTPQERNMNIDELASHIRAVERAGYMIGHYSGSHAPRSRPRIYQQVLANRREIAVKEKALYEALRLRNVALPSGNRDMLDRRQDQCLFKYIERAGGFRGVHLNEQYRRGSAHLMNGRSLTNGDVWGHLRDQCIWWDIGNERNGRWRTREGWLYPDEEEDGADIFEALQIGGRHFHSRHQPALTEPRIRV
ncbi:hypothetical protein N7G274_008674 [Stereocaulon virgatum]|uniref:Zinc finger RING-type eukaryotic domain-containing protein n=1 Tax=Stereocaulon virgatum TaxID=373712 RepID=A0ABR4A0W6_9LECA